MSLAEHMMNSLLRSGRWIFSLAIAALGVENILCARGSFQSLGANSQLHAGSPFSYRRFPGSSILFGILWIACAIGLLTARWLRASAYTLGVTYIFWTLVHVLPKYIASPGDMGLRTVVFEPLSLACIALLLPGPAATPKSLSIACRAVIAIAMIVFGVDHFIGIKFIGSLIPGWIPWHEPWVAIFGVVFIAAGIGIGLGVLERWSWIAIGTMFAVWVITLHLPRVLGLYGIPGAPRSPDEWSSLLIAVGLWGGPWAAASRMPDKPR